ncbi:ATP-binding cassette domain-containing protein [Clostridium folliculivorans]|uniref:ABC transporter n=1 Tax=Clostridium folliculivorans TaxID=2886038 RepID=A0A9W6DBI4_9CLOT|nr:ATP-binding cassette domain-containing protein [Clostridium folliculivorans]GKU26011.1 ABC transporter [Clostridium folliculivorans]GKU28097.1 ABC transporter [Clostridium folliculivorans]
MLEVKELTKEFKKTKAVSKLSFTVKPGEIVGLLGENGAGKTTTMRVVSTLLKPTDGTVLVNSFDINKEPDKVRKEIGILFGGDVGLYDRLTARENMSYFANLYGFSKEEADKRINELADELDMREYIDKRVSKFSRGMKQKVSIARAIVHSPSIMLFDEPTTGLDVRATRIIHNFIKKCKVENKTILFSSHSMREVEKLCDRVVIINKGQLVEEGTIADLKKKYNNDDLEEVFVDLIGGERDE